MRKQDGIQCGPTTLLNSPPHNPLHHLMQQKNSKAATRCSEASNRPPRPQWPWGQGAICWFRARPARVAEKPWTSA